MSAPTDPLQRITTLTPIAKILSRLDTSVLPVPPREEAPNAAVGAILAADVVAPADFPPVAAALRDGWAVAWEQTADASSYAPGILTPPPGWVEAGASLPDGTDAVLPPDAVAFANARAETSVAAAPGEGVLPAGANANKGLILRKTGDVIRPTDAAVLRALAVDHVCVRAPRVKIYSVSVPEMGEDTIAPVIAHFVHAQGGVAHIEQAATLEAALEGPRCDAVIVIGGTGAGRRDDVVKTVARLGKIDFHGFGISPGETAALGSVDGCPVLMLPGRFDAALAAFLIVGNKLLARLTGASETGSGIVARLTKKISSTVGLAEVVLVRRVADGLEPLGTAVFPLQAFSRADGWILVPAESEGLAAGATAEIRNFP